MWGPHSRRFFAYPLFSAPPGTIVSASAPDRLMTRMRQAEAATAARPRMPPVRPGSLTCVVITLPRDLAPPPGR